MVAQRGGLGPDQRRRDAGADIRSGDGSRDAALDDGGNGVKVPVEMSGGVIDGEGEGSEIGGLIPGGGDRDRVGAVGQVGLVPAFCESRVGMGRVGRGLGPDQVRRDTGADIRAGDRARDAALDDGGNGVKGHVE